MKTAPYTGTVYFNGRPRDRTFRLISSYVPQEDISFEHCTVREIVQFHMKLKADAPTDAPPELLQTECERILSDLGLKHVADTKFGGETVRGLSGGQRRRVTLAKGVCAWPHLCFQPSRRHLQNPCRSRRDPCGRFFSPNTTNSTRH